MLGRRALSTCVRNHHRPGFHSAQEYRAYLESVHADLPLGFAIATSTFSFVPAEAPHLPKRDMTLTFLYPETPTKHFAAVFTRNAFPGAPIQVGQKYRHRLLHRGAQDDDDLEIGGILINNQISNVAVSTGVSDALEICAELERRLGYDDGPDIKIIPSSTGVIGWRLPVSSIVQHLDELVEKIQHKGGLKNGHHETMIDAAEGIMTTDNYPKIQSADFCPDFRGCVVGIAKGAGMIEPSLATMLAFVLTDVAVPPQELQEMLEAATAVTFNTLSLDTDMSTSDSVMILSSAKVPYDPPSMRATFLQGLTDVCSNLAQDIVRNGEGVTHVIQVNVVMEKFNNHTKEQIQIMTGLGKAVVNSPLVKCAVAGNDPNVGRIIAAMGKYLGQLTSHIKDDNMMPALDRLEVKLGSYVIFERGVMTKLNATTEAQISAYFKTAAFEPSTKYPVHDRVVEISIDWRTMEEEEEEDRRDDAKELVKVMITGSDLTSSYVAINADYRS